ncbi:MAG: hypothetical protein HQK79_01295 [Desulfobacterales bacterium]|nr:hypothetical protein [Desulfobacterales bacterium]
MEGKILKVKIGYNPNSSSVGTDLTPLILISNFASILIPSISFFIFRYIEKIKEKKMK